MSRRNDPEWEVVDELPGEKRPKAKSGKAISIFRNKTLWIGIATGITLVIVFPIFRALLQNALRAWWIWLGLALYWIWRRIQNGQKR
ncbi:hypothetical protein [Pelagicoccus albus]|uniref:Uncharacterized protein n=1 Tax=Pelagicoccus albus TaxID=415222 RepID=A0A7X1B3S4_9BACT|nr:hypothetical protein [Pelagicoccus albus]MBC2605114.1 hypothetical protein [Pelagicoccus albus]